ncbi:transglutaminase-like domain-containing protein [Thermoactinomyces sp. DSM 45892]|uniref:transglutaminase-like domain-containing protein n=1 Tax=Thermoactinomyces sp. DSM 45892 TaxID=1882753 RepID=UPI00089C0BCA|nr:transglutaminase-like domain-containing protein [Thermoactinomyces sp. DSM 45892]SDY46197.1 Transglutaminase-like superfamily protein [Thermoactinomyces sp. DSM 45892]
METHIYTFRFPNSRKGTTRIWLSEPPTNHVQTVREVSSNRPSTSQTDVDFNRMSYYELGEGESLEKTYEITIHSSPYLNQSGFLSDQERDFYLRSTSLVEINDTIRGISRDIVHECKTVEDKAFAIFQYIKENFRYVYPPKARGVVHFLKARKGDCGEYSFLFAALCRAQGIPCRSLFGAWIGKGQHHAWNEFFVEGKGWVPVDLSMARVTKYPFRFLFSNIRTLKSKEYFGKLEDQRVVFSIDTELTPMPEYPKELKGQGTITKYPTLTLGSKEEFCWGRDLLNEKIPYMQPIYIDFEDTASKKKMSDYFGEAVIRSKDTLKNGLFQLKQSFFRIALIGILVDILFFIFRIQFTWMPEHIIYPCLLGYSILSIVRKERPVIFSIISMYAVFRLVSIF